MNMNHRTLRFLQHGPDRIGKISPFFLAKSAGVNPESFTSSLWMGLIQWLALNLALVDLPLIVFHLYPQI
jgi:hypothetical protein